MRSFRPTLYVVCLFGFFFAFFAHLQDWIMLILVWFERTLPLAQVGWQLMLSLIAKTDDDTNCRMHGRFREERVNQKDWIPDSYPPRARLNLTPKHINSDWVRVCWNTSVRLLPDLVILCPQGWGGGATWVNFCWVCPAGLSEPLPHYSLFCDHLSHFGKQVIFAIPT